MTTETAEKLVFYGSIARNLLALRDKARETGSKEAEAIEKIVSHIVVLHLHDGYDSRMIITRIVNDAASSGCTQKNNCPAGGVRY